MLTSLAFLIAGASAWTYYAHVGALIQGGFTIWIGWFFVVLCICGIESFKIRDLPTRVGWGIMALGWVLSMFAWKFSADPIMDLAIKNLMIAAVFLIISLDTPFIVISFCHLLLIFIAFLAYYDFIPSARLRPKAFIAWSYPDIAAAIQHACLVILGAHASGHLQRIWNNVGVERFIGYGYNRRIYRLASLSKETKK